MARTVQIPLVVTLTDEQEREWAADNELPQPPRAKDTVDSVQGYVLSQVQGSALGRFADVSVKGRPRITADSPAVLDDAAEEIAREERWS